MATTAAIENKLTSLWEPPKTLCGWLSTVDHKEHGIRYLVTAFAFLIVGGVEALLMRIQLTRSDLAFLSPEAYNQMFTMHGVTMIFWYASPILSGFAVYLVPLMIGARDMAYPRLNAFTYWTFLLSGIFLYLPPSIGQSHHARLCRQHDHLGIHSNPGVCVGCDDLERAIDWNLTSIRHCISVPSRAMSLAK
jgi:cytochrome c oxidase subunit 1/cytochrome c oxidase subunit I+III